MKVTRCKDCGFTWEAGMRQSCEHTFEQVEVFTAEELRESLEKRRKDMLRGPLAFKNGLDAIFVRGGRIMKPEVESERLEQLEARAEAIESLEGEQDVERRALRREVRRLARAKVAPSKIMKAANISRRWFYKLIDNPTAAGNEVPDAEDALAEDAADGGAE